MGGMYLDMFLSELVGGGASVFAAMGPLPSPLPTSAAPALSSLAPAHATAPSAFSGVGHSLKESSLQPVFPVAPRLDDLNLAMAMSMLSSGPSALKIAIVDPHGVRQVCCPTADILKLSTSPPLFNVTKSCSRLWVLGDRSQSQVWFALFHSFIPVQENILSSHVTAAPCSN